MKSWSDILDRFNRPIRGPNRGQICTDALSLEHAALDAAGIAKSNLPTRIGELARISDMTIPEYSKAIIANACLNRVRDNADSDQEDQELRASIENLALVWTSDWRARQLKAGDKIELDASALRGMQSDSKYRSRLTDASDPDVREGVIDNAYQQFKKTLSDLATGNIGPHATEELAKYGTRIGMLAGEFSYYERALLLRRPIGKSRGASLQFSESEAIEIVTTLTVFCIRYGSPVTSRKDPKRQEPPSKAPQVPNPDTRVYGPLEYICPWCREWVTVRISAPLSQSEIVTTCLQCTQCCLIRYTVDISPRGALPSFTAALKYGASPPSSPPSPPSGLPPRSPKQPKTAPASVPPERCTEKLSWGCAWCGHPVNISSLRVSNTEYIDTCSKCTGKTRVEYVVEVSDDQAIPSLVATCRDAPPPQPPSKPKPKPEPEPEPERQPDLPEPPERTKPSLQKPAFCTEPLGYDCPWCETKNQVSTPLEVRLCSVFDECFRCERVAFITYIVKVSDTEAIPSVRDVTRYIPTSTSSQPASLRKSRQRSIASRPWSQEPDGLFLFIAVLVVIIFAVCKVSRSSDSQAPDASTQNSTDGQPASSGSARLPSPPTMPTPPSQTMEATLSESPPEGLVLQIYLKAGSTISIARRQTASQKLLKLMEKNCDTRYQEQFKLQAGIDGTELSCSNKKLPDQLRPPVQLQAHRGFYCPDGSAQTTMQSARKEFCRELESDVPRAPSRESSRDEQ